MRCPKCESDNSDSAKFCKKCGTPLKKQEFNHESVISSVSGSNSSSNTTKYIIVTLIIVAIVLAGAFLYIYGFGQDQGDDSQYQLEQDDNDDVLEDEEPAQSQSSQSTAQQATPKSTSMSILGGSFSTGGGLEDKTYASIYVGPQHSGEKVKIQIFYARDGNSLNDGNIVAKTVDSSGYIDVASAYPFDYFPDYAEVNLYDDSGNLVDTQTVNLSPEEGTQTF